MVTIYTDGACSGNPGPGGWAAVMTDGRRVKEIGGRAARTTNNRMELSAAIAALQALREPRGAVRVYTDSTYVISGVTSWVQGWKRGGWLNKERKPVLNRDLWEQLDRLAGARSELSWHYVRGHRGSPGNERCDELAVAFAKGRTPRLYSGPIAQYPVDLLDVPEDAPPPRGAAAAPKPKRRGGWYLSLLAGKVERHETWPQCQERVYGQSGARFKKVFTLGEEEETRRFWGI